MIKARTTTVESCLSCPRKFKEVPFDVETATLYFGTISHLFHSSNGLFDEKLIQFYFDNVEPSHIDIGILKQISELSKTFKEKNPDAVFEVNLNKIFNDLGFEVSGTVDCILKGEDGKYMIYDFKTVKADEYYADFESKLQPFVYSYLTMLLLGQEEIEFSYICYVKNNKVKIVKHSRKITLEEAKNRTIEAMTEYKNIVESGMYYEKKNTFCKGCPFYKDGTCSQRHRQITETTSFNF